MSIDNKDANVFLLSIDIVYEQSIGGRALGTSKSDHLHGTLDLLILQSLVEGPRHGWAISRHIRDVSNNVLEVNQGSLYPALYRLEKRGWISPSWGVSETGRRAKFYSLDPEGSEHLAIEEERWREFYQAVNRVLRIV